MFSTPFRSESLKRHGSASPRFQSPPRHLLTRTRTLPGLEVADPLDLEVEATDPQPPGCRPPGWRATFKELETIWASAYSCWCSNQPCLQFAFAHFPITLSSRGSACYFCKEEVFPYCRSSIGFTINCWTNDKCGHTFCADCALKWKQQGSHKTCFCGAKWESDTPQEFLKRSCAIPSSEKSSLDLQETDFRGVNSSRRLDR